MAEYRHYEDIKKSWIYQYISGSVCKACKKPVAEMEDAHVCTVSRYNNKSFVHCPECFTKRQAKMLGDKGGDSNAVIAYEISDIVRCMKAVVLKLHVEQPTSALVKGLDELAKGAGGQQSYGRYSGLDCLARMIHNFPKALSSMSAGRFSGSGRDPSTYEKHRMELFVKLANMLRPFLPKISGVMLERLYQRHRPEMRKKHDERERRNEWREHAAKRPERLFPLTNGGEKCADTLARLLPSGSATCGGEAGYSLRSEGDKKARQALGISEKDADHGVTVKVIVINTDKGVRFITKY